MPVTRSVKNIEKLSEENIVKIPCTPQPYQKMDSNTLSDTCGSIDMSEISVGSLNIVASSFYSKSNYLSPLRRKQLKRHLPSSGSDENVSVTVQSSQKKPKQEKLLKKGSSNKNNEVKKRSPKPRVSNVNGVKKRKSSKPLETSINKRESPKEEKCEEDVEKYKNNKFFKHGSLGHLRDSVSWRNFSSIGMKRLRKHRKREAKGSDVSRKSLQPIENKTVSCPDVYDSLPDDEPEHAASTNRSYVNRSMNAIKKGFVSSFDDTSVSLPNMSIAGDRSLCSEDSKNETGQSPQDKSLTTQVSGKYDPKANYLRLVQHSLSVNYNSKREASGNRRKSTLVNKVSVTNPSKNLENVHLNNVRQKCAQAKALVIPGSRDFNADGIASGTNGQSWTPSATITSNLSVANVRQNEKGHKLPVIHRFQTPKVFRQQLPLSDSSSTISSLESDSNLSVETEVRCIRQPVVRKIKEPESIQDILKDLEESFNEIEPSRQNFGNEFDESRSSTAPHETTDISAENVLFPIFYPKEKRKDSFIQSLCPEKKKTPKVKLSTKAAVSGEMNQLFIDAGQKVIGAIECPTCGMVFHIGSEQDEKLHVKYHELFSLSLKYPGWKKEHLVGEFFDGKVIMVKKEDPNFMIRKVQDVLKIVDRDLGFPNLGFPKRPNATFLLFVLAKAVVGCLVAESITSARRVELDSTASITSCYPEDGDSKVEHWCSGTREVKAICGVNRIWVSREHRRMKIATRLLDCLRVCFLYGYTMSKTEIAFSDPSVNGRDFASSYMGTNNFLVYK